MPTGGRRPSSRIGAARLTFQPARRGCVFRLRRQVAVGRSSTVVETSTAVMRLTRKLVFGFLVAVVLALSINGWYRARHEIELFDTDLAERHATMATVLGATFAQIYPHEGRARALEVLEQANRSTPVSIRWVELDDMLRLGSGVVGSERVSDRLREGEPVHLRNGTIHRVVSYLPVQLDGAVIGALEISEPLARVREYAWNATINVAFAMASTAVGAGIVAVILGYYLIGRPLRELALQAQRIGRGDLAHRVVLRQKDEISELASEMNAMCARLVAAREDLQRETAARIRTVEQLRHADRLNTVGRIASGLAHELGTPLNVIGVHAEILGEDPEARPRLKEAIGVILEQCERMARIIRRLLEFARRRQPARTDVDLIAAVRRSIEVLGPLASKSRVTIAGPPAGDSLVIRGDPVQVEQVVTNLIMNAIQAMPSGGTIEVAIDSAVPQKSASHDGRQRAYARIRVADQGTGIAAEDLGHIFEPFYTTKPAGEGTGLGLSVVQGIVQDHDGMIEVTSASGAGTEFVVYLPMEATS